MIRWGITWLQNDIHIKGSKVLILGITFKENCPDVRNTKVVDVIKELKAYGTNITIYDPWANPKEVKHEYHLETIQTIPDGTYDAIVLTVAHQEYLDMDLKSLLKPDGVLYDVKGVLKGQVNGRL